MRAPAILTAAASHLHRPPNHPESADRITAIEAALSGAGLDHLRRPDLQLDGDPVPGLERARVTASQIHFPEYVDRMLAIGEQVEREGAGGWIDRDTFVGPGSIHAACAGLLTAIEATQLVVTGKTRTAFSLCRPPGHHATRGQAMGFCFFNNAAAAAQEAIAAGLGRVAIVDFDVHHGNGTQEIFYARSDVLYVSTHQWPLYPGTGATAEQGEGRGEGYTLNLPLPAGTGDRGYLEAFDSAVLPAIARFAPELIVVSAGYDAAAADRQAQMEVSTAGFAQLSRRLLGAASALCQGRSVWVLEGGYDLDALGEGVVASVLESTQGR